MCNLVAIKTDTQPGDALFLGARSHVMRCETGSAASVSGAVLETIQGLRGHFGGAELEEALYPESVYTARPSLVCVEQTHNFGGGSIKVHMDGARLFNAVVATGISEDHRRAAKLADFLTTKGVEVEPVDTNLVFFKIQGRTTDSFLSELESRGVRMGSVGTSIRAATHLDIDDKGIEVACSSLSQLL